MNNLLVSISCITYNHASYIRECLDGFLMQQCNFSFEVLIHDDASTDGTQEIIKEYQEKYPDIIKPIFQVENQYSKGLRGVMARFNFPRAQGKYIALCEGDDYWTDPLKLQRQVDFLENNPEYSLVCGGFKSINTVTGEEEVIIKDIENAPDNTAKGFDITLDRFFKQWLTKTLTLTFRKNMYNEAMLTKYKYIRDVHLYYHLLKEGKGYYMKEVLGVYRIHRGGIFSEISEKEKSKIYFKVYGELYKSNRSDLLLKKKYLRILQNIEKDKSDIISPFALYVEIFKLTRKKKDFIKLIKSLI